MIVPKRDETLDESKEWREDCGGRNQVCRGCTEVEPGLYPRPLLAVVLTRPQQTISDSGRNAFPVMKVPLFERLRRIAPGWVPGPVWHDSGERLVNVVTVHVPRSDRVYLHGRPTHDDAYGQCPVCGRRFSLAIYMQSPVYLSEQEVRGKPAVWVGFLYLAVREDVIAELGLEEHRDLRCQWIGVRPHPLPDESDA